MKRLLSAILIAALLITSVPVGALAETRIEYPSVNAVLLKSDGVLEKEFREWASMVIRQYYVSYARYSSGSQYEMIEFDRGWLAQYKEEYIINVLSGIYREYYLASIMKYEFDVNVQKNDYTVARPDEGSEEWIRQKKEFYMLMLADAIQEKVGIDPDAFADMDKGIKGVYTLKLDQQTGLMKMDYDANGVMGNLEYAAEMQTREALGSFLIDSIELVAQGAYEYVKLNSAAKASKFADFLINTLIDGAGAVMEKWNSVERQNCVNKAMNNIAAIHQANIANSVLQHSNRIVGYLERIYSGSHRDYAIYNSDPVFLEAVQEMIGIINTYKKSNAEKTASQLAEEWYAENGAEIKNILSGAEVFEIVFEEAMAQLAKGVVSMIQIMIKDASVEHYQEAKKIPGDHTEVFIGLMCDMALLAIKEYISDVTNKIFAEKQKLDGSVLRALFNTDGLMEKIEKKCILELGNFAAALEKDSQAVKNMATVGGALNTAILDFYEVYENNGGQFSQEVVSKLITTVFDLGVAFGSASLSTYIANFDAEAYAEKFGKEAAEEKLKNCKFIQTILSLKGKTMAVAGSAAKMVYEALDQIRGEDQDAYRAKYMYSAYAVSRPIAEDLQGRIGMLIMGSDANITSVIMNPETPLETIRGITDKIQMQIEYDLVGMKWLTEILGSNENRGWANDSNYYEFMMDSVEGTTWESRMTSSVARTEHGLMIGIRDLFQSGWKDEFNELF